jgi:hypothetical protein
LSWQGGPPQPFATGSSTPAEYILTRNQLCCLRVINGLCIAAPTVRDCLVGLLQALAVAGELVEFANQRVSVATAQPRDAVARLATLYGGRALVRRIDGAMGAHLFCR